MVLLEQQSSQPATYTLGGLGLRTICINLDVYPNPSRDIFHINFTSQEMQTIIVKIVNLIGKEIFIELTEFTGQYTKEIDMGLIPRCLFLRNN